MKFDSLTLNKLIKESDSKSLVLPNFQRDFVWNVDKQKTLLSSFLLNLPTGSILTLQGNKTDFAAREVCFPNKIIPAETCKYLLDGQQRFSSLKNIFTNLYDAENPDEWRKVWVPLFIRLRHRFYLKVRNDSTDILGFQDLNFDQKKFEDTEPSFLNDSIETKAIYVKEVNKYFHPGFNPTDSQGKPLSPSKRRTKIVSGYADERLIPLYELYDSNNHSLHVKVLRMISSRRAYELENEIGDDQNELIRILEPVEDNIGQYIEDNDENAIRTAWVRLSETWTQNVQNFLENCLASDISEISLEKHEVGKAFSIFEIINQPGTPLDEYDLIVAKAARNHELDQLTQRILAHLGSNLKIPESISYHLKSPKPLEFNPLNFNVIDDKSPQKDFKTRFLQMLSVISYCIKGEESLNIKHLKREKILDLDEGDINGNYKLALKALLRSYVFMHYRCGVVSIDKVPFKLMAVPIAYQLLDDNVWNDRKKIDKIEYWYWSSLFSGHYKMNQNQRSFDDILNLKKFLTGESPHEFDGRQNRIFKDEGYSDKKTLMFESDEKIQKSIHSAILQYIISQQPEDFLKEDNTVYLNSWDIAEGIKVKFNGSFETLKIEDHHICPLAESTTLKESASDLRSKKQFILNSPLNRTYISKFANRKIGSLSPSKYFDYVCAAAKHGHLIPMPINEKYKKKDGESNLKYYKRVVSDRYEDLTVQTERELLTLKG